MGDIRTSQFGSTPFGTSSTRPTNPQIGQTYYNGTLGVQEIYTSSGWLPATGANDFNVTLNGSVTTATFTKEYFAGAYTIASALLDNTYDIYVYDTTGNLAGYTKSPSLNATGNFNKIVVIGGTQGDLLSFSYKTTFTATTTTSEVNAGPFLQSAEPSALPNLNNAVTLTGGNFAADAKVFFVGSDNVEREAKSVTRTAVVQLIAVRPDDLPAQYSPYSVIVRNPSIPNQPTGSNLNKLSNAISAGVAPVWVTSASLGNVYQDITLQATDSDGGSNITYSLVTGTLPGTLNSSTGVIAAPFTTSSYSFTIRATDSGGNYVDRAFTVNTGTSALSWSTGGTITTSGGYRYHTFTTTGSAQTFTPSGSGNIEVIMWGAGGAAGGTGGSSFCYGGGGAYAKSTIAATVQNYIVSVGGGGQLGTQGCVLGTGGTGGTGYGSLYQGGNGTAAGFTPCSGTGGGGGGASVFLNAAGTALVVAGGGGGGAGTESAENGTGAGGGGGQNGANGTASGATGGTAGGSGSTNGGTPSLASGDHSGSGGGGGGVAGGTGGTNVNQDAVSQGGGGGGTSLGQTVNNGNYQTPGNSTDPLRAGAGLGGGSGSAGANGIVIVRYAA